MASNMILHAGGEKISFDDLKTIAPPPGTHTWHPVRHSDVIEVATKTMAKAGFEVTRAEYAVSHENKRMFATLDLRSNLGDGVTLAAGVRNSNDQTFPIGFCAGSRVFICDNLAFASELAVKRKHTRYGRHRFVEAISLAVGKLGQFQLHEAKRIDFMRNTLVQPQQAESFILRSFEQGIVTTRELPDVIKQLREPTYEEFQNPSAWSLFNAFTTAIGPRKEKNAQAHAKQTMDLYAFFEKELHMNAFVPQLAL